MVYSSRSPIPMGVNRGTGAITANRMAQPNQLDSVLRGVERAGASQGISRGIDSADKNVIRKISDGVSVPVADRIHSRARPRASVEFGVVVESMVYDTRGEALVRVSRNGNVKVVDRSAENVNATGMRGSPRAILDLPSSKLESVVVLLDDGRTQFVVQEVQGRRFESGDRIRLTTDGYMRLSHL